MRSFVLLFLAMILLQACSSSDASPTNSVEDNLPTANTGDSYKGDFVSSAHPTQGKVTVNANRTLLTLTDFKTDDGPFLELYLAMDATASTYISLGVLKGVDGDYEYNLPVNVDYSVYDHVIVWCVNFTVNFGYAVLKEI